MSKPIVGFIGLGAMGEPMAGHLLAGGFRVSSCANRSREAIERLAAAGPRDFYEGALDKLVLQHRHAQGPHPAVRLRNLDPAHWLRSVRPAFQAPGKVCEPLLQCLPVLPPCLAVDSGRGIPLEVEVSLPQSPQIVNVVQ